MNQNNNSMLYDAGKRSIAAAYVLWFFFGWLGAHRFYLGRKLSGLLMVALAAVAWYRIIAVEGAGLLAFIFLALWVLIDAALIPSIARSANLQSAQALSAR